MSEGNNDLLTKLRNEEKIKYPKCHSGNVIPYNAVAEKAHYFYCSNEICDWYLQIDPIIEIE
ncbi:MAG: hypothetical protein LUI06_04540 [Ruminococcus sp.]|nr:hypothetical protein [Ruminococcus sp.]